MKIVSKFRVPGKIEEGYMFEQDGVMMSATVRGLYDEEYLQALVESGYKIVDYHGNIISPDGINIKDMAETPYTGSIIELDNTIELAELALTESEATRYFSREVRRKPIDFKEPTPTIRTRSELMKFLQQMRFKLRLAGDSIPLIPLNSFVAKEALFTLEDLRDTDVRDCLNTLEERRRIRSYRQYQELIKFLQEEGVLGETFTPDDVRHAYCAWGIEGFKSDVVDVREEIGTIKDILEVKESAGDQGRIKKFIMDREGIIYYPGGSVDGLEASEQSNSLVYPVDTADFAEKYQSANKWGAEYTVINCYSKIPFNRTIYTMVDENGTPCECRIDNEAIAILDNFSCLYFAQNIFIDCIDGTAVGLGNMNTADEYEIINLCRAKARDLIKERTVDCPIKDSFNMAIKEGVSPEAAMRYITRQIADNPDVNADILGDKIDVSKAFYMYKTGPERKIIDKYNPENLPWDNLDELIDIMSETKDQMIENNSYMVFDKNSYAPADLQWQEEFVDRPIESLEFAKSVKKGSVAVDNLKQGLESDKGADFIEIADAIRLLLEVKYGDMSVVQFKQKLSSIESLNLLNFDREIRERDRTYRGYLKDRAILNSKRASQSTSIVYINRVFREISNNPDIEHARHYMFQCIVLDNSRRTKQELAMTRIAKAYKEAVMALKDIPYEYKEILALEAEGQAAKIAFKVALNNYTLSHVAEGMVAVTESLKMGEWDKVLNILIANEDIKALTAPGALQQKFVTLYDWCQYEVSVNGAFNMYCINADITPWNVQPKQGFHIPEYNFAINAIRPKVIEGWSQGYRDKLAENKAKVTTLTEEGMMNYLFRSDSLVDDILVSYDAETIDTALELTNEESIKNYFERFTMHNNKAKESGKYLFDMQLKSDVIYSMYAEAFPGVKVFGDDTYKEISDPKDALTFMSTMDVILINEGSHIAELMGGNVVKNFDAQDISFDRFMALSPIYMGTFSPKSTMYVSGDKLTVIKPVVKGKQYDDPKVDFNLTIAKEETLKTLTDKGYLYQLSATSYLVRANNGTVVVEVK